MSQVERIQEMEKRLNKYATALHQVQQALEELEASQEDYIQLRDYYSSQAFFDDVSFSNSPDFPQDLACGVLSEDAVYDLLDEHFQTALQLLDLSSAMLKER